MTKRICKKIVKIEGGYVRVGLAVDNCRVMIRHSSYLRFLVLRISER